MSSQYPSITIRGRYLLRDNIRFFVRGLVYQRPDKIGDPITDEDLPLLRRDIALFRELGINTLYVYWVDSNKSHGQAMKLLGEAGIYVLASLSSRRHCINRFNRLRPYDSYNPALLTSFFQTVNLLAEYPNTLGVVVADQLINDDEFLHVVPVIKAVVRDLKRYMELKSMTVQQRILPVAYDAMTCGSRDVMVLDYLKTDDPLASIDFWTCKNYFSNKGDEASSAQSDDQYDQLTKFDLPIFFSEYSDGTCEPREWDGIRAVFSPPMDRIFSGLCVYQFYELSNGYGLVRMFDHDGDIQRSTQRQAVNLDKVVETRETEQGSLLVYHDFQNLKLKLMNIRTLMEIHTQDIVISETGTKPIAEPYRRSWPWEPEYTEPETCLNWDSIVSTIKDHE